MSTTITQTVGFGPITIENSDADIYEFLFDPEIIQDTAKILPHGLDFSVRLLGCSTTISTWLEYQSQQDFYDSTWVSVGWQGDSIKRGIVDTSVYTTEQDIQDALTAADIATDSSVWTSYGATPLHPGGTITLRHLSFTDHLDALRLVVLVGGAGSSFSLYLQGEPLTTDSTVNDPYSRWATAQETGHNRRRRLRTLGYI